MADLSATSWPTMTHAMAALPVLVGVIGPPGAGKSTIVATLAEDCRLPVFRLREAILQRPHLLAGFGSSMDPLGWVTMEAVRQVLHAALVEDRFAAGAIAVLLDNFPGPAAQLELLAEIANDMNAKVGVLELRAELAAVVTRVTERRVCLYCGPDTHAPAIPSPDEPGRCSACGAELFRRESDAPRLHGLRLARYGANQAEIAAATAKYGIPHLWVPADGELPEVQRLARHALNRLMHPAPADAQQP